MMMIDFAALQRMFQLNNPDYFDKGFLELGCDEIQLYKYLLQTVNSPYSSDFATTAQTNNITCYVGESENNQIISFIDYTVRNGDTDERRLAALFYTYIPQEGNEADWAIMPYFIATGKLVEKNNSTHFAPDDVRYRKGTETKSIMTSIDVSDENAVKAAICYADDIFTTCLTAETLPIGQFGQWFDEEHQELTTDRYEILLDRTLSELIDETGLSQQPTENQPSPYHFRIDGPSTLQ